MRFLALLFNVYVLLLSCSPCADGEELMQDRTVSFTVQQDKNSHEHEKEDCSPFCACTCCGRSVICNIYHAPATAKIIFQTQCNLFAYTQPVVSLSTGKIFQPPRKRMI